MELKVESEPAVLKLKRVYSPAIGLKIDDF